MSVTLHETDYFLMSNLHSKHTGLPFVVWISVKGNARHDVRVKVSRGPKTIPDEFVSVAIRPDVHVVEGNLGSDDLALLREWIEVNRAVIVKYWEGELDTVDAILALKRIDR